MSATALVPASDPAESFRRHWWQRMLFILNASRDGTTLQEAQRHLRALHAVLGTGPVPLTSNVQTDTLRRCLHEAERNPDLLAQRWLAPQVLALLELLRGSCETPGIATLPLMRRLCGQLHALLEVARQPYWRERLCRVEVLLLAQYLRGQRFEAATLQHCCGLLWALHYRLPVTHPALWLPTPVEMNSAIPACMAPALQRMRTALAAVPNTQEGTAPLLTAPLLLQGYELAVVALQLRATAAGLLFGCLQALLNEHWFRLLPLPERSRQRLQAFYGTTQLDSVTLREALYSLAELWPPTPVAGSVQVPLAGEGGGSATSVTLATIPVLLARRLPNLNAARQAWFARQTAFAPHQLALQGELMMLERGAAAFKVRGIERLCGRLLELLMLLDLQGSPARFPGNLLWRAHCHLLHLLDSAAAWWEATPDQTLLRELHEHSRNLLPLPSPANTIAEPSLLHEDQAWNDVRRQLLGYVQSFSELLEIQMRLEISGDGAQWPAERLWRLQAALMPLLRYVLLEFSLAPEQRRALRLPTTGCLWLCLRRGEADCLHAQLRDDSAHPVPGAVQWQQLQHRVLKHGGADIHCERTPLGRCFMLTLPLVPARAGRTVLGPGT